MIRKGTRIVAVQTIRDGGANVIRKGTRGIVDAVIHAPHAIEYDVTFTGHGDMWIVYRHEITRDHRPQRR